MGLAAFEGGAAGGALDEEQQGQQFEFGLVGGAVKRDQSQAGVLLNDHCVGVGHIDFGTLHLALDSRLVDLHLAGCAEGRVFADFAANHDAGDADGDDFVPEVEQNVIHSEDDH